MFGKMMAIALLMVMAAAVLPMQEAYAEGQYGYLVINNDTVNRVVNFRPKPGSSDYKDRLPEGLVMEIIDTTTYRNVLWYRVKNLKNSETGYIHGDFFKTMDEAAVQEWTDAGTDLFPSYAPEIPITPGLTPLPGVTPFPEITPTPKPELPDDMGNYVITVKQGVNVRKTPDGTCLTGPMSSKIPKGTILPYYGVPVELAENKTYYWQYIDFNGLEGYIRSDCFEYCDFEGNYVIGPTPVPEATPTPELSPGSTPQQGTVVTKAGGLNFRKTAGGTMMYQIKRGVTLPYFGTDKADGYTWYYVYDASTGTYGFLRSDFLNVYPNGSGDTETDAPSTVTGYVATSMSDVYLRESAFTGADACGKVKAKGTVLLMTGNKVKDRAYENRYWYPVVTSDGTRGYIRNDCIFELAQWQVDYYNQYGTCPTPTPAPATPRPGNSDYLITTDGSLNVRTGPGKDNSVLFGDTQLDKGYVTKFYDTKMVGQVKWYKIKVLGSDGWVHGSYVRVLTNAEYDAWQGEQPTPTPKPSPTPLPDPSTFSDLALTTADKVILRASASTSSKELTRAYYEGTQVKYLGKYELDKSGDFYWFNVKYGNLSGWMHGDFVRVLTEEEKTMYELSGDPDAPREATYRNLSLGSTGEDVTALQNELVEKGYLDAAYATGIYQSATEAAVRSFQKDNKLTVDGVAGEQTQHALFGTVPEGTYTGSSVTPVLYPVEMVDWWTGDVNEIWSPGTVAILTDVKTGISFRAQRLFGANHADAEPKTTDDTAAICRIYGVSNPQEISDRESELQSWRRRPMWVTIGGRTFCGSMYGIPHNFKDDSIPDNGYNGQFCIHFTNSMTHGSDDNPAKVDVDNYKNGYYGHQSAIKDAYKLSESGWKDK